MPEISNLSSQEAERAELDAVAEALAKSPRLSRLLRYLGERYFLGQSDQLHEYNIATEVFGRSKTAFDAGEDAIARVEAHRLRKRLKAFYETEGKSHLLQLSIPSGSYVPCFTRRAEALPIPSSDDSQGGHKPSFNPSSASGNAPQADHGETRGEGIRLRFGGRVWLYPILAAAALLGALGVYRAAHPGGIQKGANSAAFPVPPAAAAQPVSSDPAPLPIRLIAGYLGKPQIDSAGAVWTADQYFRNGGVWNRSASFIARTSDPLLFEQWRTGDFFYDIPLQPGIYEVHLYFVTQDRAADTTSTFTVGINGSAVLTAFDVNSDALGENIADERIFRDVSPGKDGFLHLSFTSERGAPALNALEILPGIPHRQLPIRLVTQPTSFTDHVGQVWHPDNYYMNGRQSTQRQQIAGSPDPDLFGAERYGHFTYAIPVDTRGRYTLVLHFAEFYFGPHASGVGGTGSRVFRVMCNGVLLLDDFDIFKEAGSLHALTKTFYHLKPTAQGKLNLTFEPIVNNATVSGIEVLDESQ
ncbi:MAG: malectin domain-containing carbohydrate-binding protein [Terracidiphilus sp.]|jgi:hypothetical protein